MHVDVNIFDRQKRIDEGRWLQELTEEELKDETITRPDHRFREFQCSLQLSDGEGGETCGSMGFCVGSQNLLAECARIAPKMYGRSGRFPSVTRIGESPTLQCDEHGARADKNCWCGKIKVPYYSLISLSLASLFSSLLAHIARLVCQKNHKEMRKNLVFPAFRFGDIFVWSALTAHCGPYRGNTTEVPKVRMYVNTMPQNALNRQYVEKELWPSIEKSTHSHGPQEQRHSEWSVDVVAQLTERQKKLFGKKDDAESD